jgi:hypothetical protein
MFRPFRPSAQNAPLNAPQIEVLAKANQLVQVGKPGEAAPLFAQLARDLDSTHPRRAAILHASAAHTYADSADPNLALTQARAALTMFTQYKMMLRAPRFYSNILRKFNDKGMKDAANAIQNEFGGQIGSLPAQAPAMKQAKRGSLPTNCPKCGAPVHSADASWIDEQTAECDYCGSSIRAN